MYELSDITDRKYIDHIDVEGIEIETDTGWQPLSSIHRTVPYGEWYLETESGDSLLCADTHIVFDQDFNQVYVCNLIANQSRIQTSHGSQLVTVVEYTGNHESMFDVTVDSDDHRFYTNNILSHNSTVLDALTFGLFGKPFRNINRPQLVNTITKKNAVVEIEFAANSRQYKIIRGIKPNVFEVYCDGTLINQSADNRDYQAVVEQQILKTNYKTFCQVVILGSAAFVPFMQLPLASRRAIIEDLLDLEIFTVMNVLLKKDIENNGFEVTEVNNQLQVVRTKIELVNQHVKELKSRNKDLINGKQQEISDLESLLSSQQTDLQQLYEKITLAQMTASECYSDARDKLSNIESLSFKLTSKLDIITQEINFFMEHENCPTCTQSITSNFRESIVKQRSGEQDELKAAIVKLENKKHRAIAHVSELARLEEVISQSQTDAYVQKTNIQHTTSKIDQLHHEIDNANRTTTTTIDTKSADLEQQLAEVTERYNQLQHQRTVLGHAGQMLKDGGIKTRIVNQYVPIINQLINKYLAEFDFFVEFNLDQQFNETIKSRHRDTFTYSSFSEGEKQKIDLAILFAWRAVAKLRNSLNTNVLILDEVFDASLDSNSAEDLLKILQNLAADTNVFVISHREQLVDKFDNQIKFVKTRCFSRILEG